MKAGSSTRVRQMVAKGSEPIKILIVDDDVYFRALVNRLLTAQGYEVLEARSTNEAESLLRHRPALAIIDYRLPNTDGAAFIKTLRERGVTFPIVFCSGSTYSHQTLANVRNVLQVELIVRKPIVAAEFVSQLQLLLPLPYESQTQPFPEQLAGAEDSFAPEEFSVESSGEQLITDMIGSMFADQEVRQSPPVFELQEVHELQRGHEFQEADQFRELQEIELDPLFTPDSAAALETSAMLQDLAILYLSDLPATMGQIRYELATGLEKKDINLLESATNRAHQVRGTSGSLGFTQLSLVAGRLEDYLNEGAGSDNSYQLLNNIAVALLLDQIEQLIQSEETCYGLAPGVDKEAQLAPPDAAAFSSTGRILVVDNNADQCAALCDSLTGKNSLVANDIETRAIHESLSVFSVLEEYRPHLLFIKGDMPGTSGYDICRMIRCNPRWAGLPLVIITDDCSARCRVQIFDCGASDFVVSPIVDGELKVKLNAHLPALPDLQSK